MKKFFCKLKPWRGVVVWGCLLLVGAGVMPSGAMASADPLVEGARQCTQYLGREEQRNGIPTHLLTAVASTESGRWHNRLGLALPWPWTINAEGKGYYFGSKAEAVDKTYALLRRGIRSIDVGCMQVNLKHHPEAFRTLNEAFDPASNVAYGAKFLRSNYEDLGDWVKATAAYHSRTPVYGRQYLGTIEKNWSRIVSKVDQARTRAGMPVERKAIAAHDLRRGAAALAKAGDQPLTRVLEQSNTNRRATSHASPAKEGRGITASPKRFHVIQVSGTASRSSIPAAQVSVIRPVAAVATNRSDASMLLRGQSDSLRRVNLSSARPPVSEAGQGARFVFAN